MINENELVANKLKELRIAHNYTQEDIAANIGVTQPTYNLYETGKRKLSIIAGFKLAHFYNLTLDELMELAVPLDNEIFYDSPSATARTLEEAEFLSFAGSENTKDLRKDQIDVLFGYEKLSKEHRASVSEYIQFLLSQERK